MPTQTTKTAQHGTGEKLTTGTIAFWATTFVVVLELTAGSVWNLLRIEWVRVQLSHLGYPGYFAYISGAWQVGGAAVIIAPRFPRLKEGCRGDAPSKGRAMFAIASWALR